MGTVLQSKLEGQDERTAQRDRHCYTYLGRDPEGPLAPLGDPNPLLHQSKVDLIGSGKCSKWSFLKADW